MVRIKLNKIDTTKNIQKQNTLTRLKILKLTRWNELANKASKWPNSAWLISWYIGLSLVICNYLFFQKQFASVMEVLGNEALGKIIKLVDETKFLLDLECKTFSGKRAKRPGSILNILSVGGLGKKSHSVFTGIKYYYMSVQGFNI